MTTTAQLIDHLKDHMPYELLMLRYTHERMQHEDHPLVYNAMYESFCMHVRNLRDFLNNDGTGNNLKAKEYASDFRAPKDAEVQRIINTDMQGQVFHFNKDRPTKPTEKVGLEKCKLVFDHIEKMFAAFLAANWNDNTLKAKFRSDLADPKQVEKLIRDSKLYVYANDAPGASSGGLQFVGSTPGYTGYTWYPPQQNPPGTPGAGQAGPK